MPRLLDPNLTFDIVLDSDKDSVPPPTFVYRILNGREWLIVGEVNDLVNEGGELQIKVMLERVYAACVVGLVGWKNMVDRDGNEVPFSVDAIRDIIDPFEAGQDLLPKVLAAGQPSVEDKKKLESSPASEEV